MEYLQVRVTTTTECADLVSMALLEAGSEGVSIVDRADVESVLKDDKSWDYADDSLTKYADERVYVSGFFPRGFSAESIMDALERLRRDSIFPTGSLETEICRIKSADWEKEWRKYYRPIKLDGVVIVPKWLSYEGDDVKILMDPGMAFGTGGHETTAMCIRLLQRLPLKGKRAADVGCGSGILGIAAVKLGAKSCVMSDIDEDAVKSAQENALLNGVADRITALTANLTDDFSGKADVVTANLTADILLKLRPQLNLLLAEGGHVIISGLINSRADEVIDSFRNDFEVIERLKEGEWQAALLKAL